MSPLLAHVAEGPEDAPRTAYVLHGILGSKSNWRSLSRRLAERLGAWRFVIVDLRLHGDSLRFDPPHTLSAVAADLCALSAALGRAPDAVIGHSFGAKSALAWIDAAPNVFRRAVILDTNPGARPDARGSENTLATLRALAGLGTRFATRAVFIDGLQREGVSRGIAQWLAMNLVVDGEGYRIRLDLDAIEALLDDYFAQDLWRVIEAPPPTLTVDFVVGGRSPVLDADERARLAAAAGARLRVHTLPEAGHWVHVDAPEAVSAVIVDALAG